MIGDDSARKPVILFGVTSAKSIRLLGRIPAEMVAFGWDVHIVSSFGPECLAIETVGISHHVIEMQRAPSPVKDLKALLMWLALLGKLRPDVVSIGTPKAALLGLTAARVRRVSVRVYTLRGLRLEGQRGGWLMLLWFFELCTSWSSTHIISASHSLMTKYRSLKLSRDRKISVLGFGSSHGVDVETFTPFANRKAGWTTRRLLRAREEGKAVVAFVGRFSRDKGAPTLAACKRAFEEMSISHEFVIVGEVEDSREVLEAMNSSGQQVLHILGLEDLSPIYPLFDLLLLPSKREGFPNVVLEAAASGVPAVVSSATGAVDSVVSGKTGLVVPLGDEAGFLRAAIKLATNRGLASSMGEFARRRVVEHFNDKKVSANHVTYYASLLKNNGF